MNSQEEDIFTRDYYYGYKNSNYWNYEYWDNDWHWYPIIKKLKRFDVSGRILDIGCAFGYFLKRAEPLFRETYGIDISRFAIDKAKGLLPKTNLQVMDLNKNILPFPDEYFDVITAFDVLEHTQSIKESLEKIIPKIKRNGYLLISVPIKDSLIGRIIKALDRDTSHISIPTRNELELLIAESGLKIIKKGFFWDLIWFRFRGLKADYQFILQRL